MNLLNLFRRQQSQSAPAARERLQILLAHERSDLGHSDLVDVLRREIIAVIEKHVKVDGEAVKVQMDRNDKVSTLEVDVELPRDATLNAA